MIGRNIEKMHKNIDEVQISFVTFVSLTFPFTLQKNGKNY